MGAVDETPIAGRLDRALAELAALREENARLRHLIGTRGDADQASPGPPRAQSDVTRLTAEAEKIALFRSLFRGREDVFAVRWEARDGRAGYAPANRYDAMRGAWRARVAEGERDEHVRLTDAVLRDHLTGKHVVGVYPLLLTDECWFLAIDFDKAGWRDDVAAVLDACDELAIPASLERSRSGRGGHVWVFFAESIPAAQARKLGCAVLTRAMERRHQLGLDSYDRLFPNQDTLPYGGFGNLIALPLQRAARARHDSEFLDRDFVPYPDQWAYLASLRRMSAAAVDAVVQVAARANAIIGLRLSLADEDDKDPWTRPPSRRRAEPPIAEPLPATIRVVHANQVYVEKAGLPSAISTAWPDWPRSRTRSSTRRRRCGCRPSASRGSSAAARTCRTTSACRAAACPTSWSCSDGTASGRPSSTSGSRVSRSRRASGVSWRRRRTRLCGRCSCTTRGCSRHRPRSARRSSRPG